MSNVSIEKARDSSINKIVYQYELDDEDRLNNNYECMECDKKLSVHKNKNDLYYFKHPKDTCIFNNLDSDDKKLIILNSEYHSSDRHSTYQDKLIQFLEKNNFTAIAKEKSFFINKKVQHRADIYFEDSNHKFVIEVQISSLSFRNIRKRIDFYKSQGIYLLWVVDIDYIGKGIRQFLKDILKYGSKYNEIFSFNDSNKLQVHYQKIYYWKKKNKIWEEYKVGTMIFNNLSFNEQDMTICYYNREKIRKKLYIDNPMLLLNHIGVGDFLSDSDDDLVKKLKYYQKYYQNNQYKFLELIDKIFERRYECRDSEYYDIVIFLIEQDMMETLKFLLPYGVNKRKIYNPRIDDEKYHLLRKNAKVYALKKELKSYYALDEY